MTERPEAAGLVPAGEGEGGTSWSAEIGTVQVTFGSGCLARLGEVALALGGQRVLVVSDPGVVRAGHAGRALAVLEEAGLAAALFDGVEENPGEEHVEAGVALARRRGADLLVGLGGGSAMDCAKGVNFLLTNGGRMEDYRGFGKASRPLLPSIGVPTTAGTGSDAQSYALIRRSADHRKMACGDRKARFRDVLLDPALAATAPRPVAAAAGLDALSHAVESYVTRRRNPVSALYGREAWRLLAGSFEAALVSPGAEEAHGRMLLGAHLAGAAIEASMLGAAHAAANPLTAAYGTVHGVAVALMLPAVVRFNAGRPLGEDGERRVADLYRELLAAGGERPEGDPAEALAARIEGLRRAAGLPETLRAAGVAEAALPDLAREATLEWTGTFNPRPLSEADFLALYRAAW